MQKLFLILFLAGLFSFAATSCGSDSGKAHQAETEAAEAAETPASEEAAEEEMETIDSVSNQQH